MMLRRAFLRCAAAAVICPALRWGSGATPAMVFGGHMRWQNWVSVYIPAQVALLRQMREILTRPPLQTMIQHLAPQE